MKKVIPIFIFLLLTMLTLVNAVPPVTEVQQYPEGYTITEMQVEYVKINTDLRYNLFVENSSNGKVITNETINCTYFMVDSQGNELLVKQMDYIDYWSIIIDKGNLTELGTKYYGVYCSNSEGGSLSGAFEVTPSGLNIETSKAIMNIGLLFIFIFIFTVCVAAIPQLPSSNTPDETGHIIEINYLKYLRGILYAVAYIIFYLIMVISSDIATSYLNSNLMGLVLGKIAIIMGLFLVPLMFIWLFFILQKIITDNQFLKESQRGVFREGL